MVRVYCDCRTSCRRRRCRGGADGRRIRRHSPTCWLVVAAAFALSVCAPHCCHRACERSVEECARGGVVRFPVRLSVAAVAPSEYDTDHLAHNNDHIIADGTRQLFDDGASRREESQSPTSRHWLEEHLPRRRRRPWNFFFRRGRTGKPRHQQQQQEGGEDFVADQRSATIFRKNEGDGRGSPGSHSPVLESSGGTSAEDSTGDLPLAFRREGMDEADRRRKINPIAGDADVPFDSESDDVVVAESPLQALPDEADIGAGGSSSEEASAATITAPTTDFSLSGHREPILYRYYGKSRSRTQSGGGSLPVILIGPNIDHLKVVGQELAAKGFTVIACERLREDESGHHDRESQQPHPVKHDDHDDDDDDKSAVLLVSGLLDALRWNRAVLVGCDVESRTAIQAALHLAPAGRIAGLVLTGDLQQAEDYVYERSSRAGVLDRSDRIRKQRPRLTSSSLAVDLFLQSTLKCPYTVVWDGDAPSVDIDSPALQRLPEVRALKNRSLLLGGGAAPHRRHPELFAWSVTRFVEERIAPAVAQPVPQGTARGGQQEHPASSSSRPVRKPRPVGEQFSIQEFLSPESFVVTGRLIGTLVRGCCVCSLLQNRIASHRYSFIFSAASIILYWTLAKVLLHQYGNVHSGVVNVNAAVKSVKSYALATRDRVSSFFWKIGSAAVFTARILSKTEKKKRSRTAKEEEEEPEDGDNLPPPETSSSTKEKRNTTDTDDGFEQGLGDEEGGPKETNPPQEFRPSFLLDKVVA